MGKIIAEYVAAAGDKYGWIKVQALDDGYFVYWGRNGESYATVVDSVDIEELASWLERHGANELEAIEERANIHGASAVPEATGDDKGPFYVLMTRYWGGQIETSSIVMDSCGRKPLEFKRLWNALAWIKNANDRAYHQSYNESGRPSYKVVTRRALGTVEIPGLKAGGGVKV